MSNFVNEITLERAEYVKTHYESTMVEDMIDTFIKDGDLEALHQFLMPLEADIAREEIYGTGEASDVY